MFCSSDNLSDVKNRAKPFYSCFTYFIPVLLMCKPLIIKAHLD